MYSLNKQFAQSNLLNSANPITHHFYQELQGEKKVKEKNFLMFLPRGVLMGYEPFQRHRGEREMVALVTRQTNELHTHSLQII